MTINIQNWNVESFGCRLACTPDEVKRGCVKLTADNKRSLYDCATKAYEELLNYTEETSPNLWQLYHHWRVGSKHAVVHNDKLIW